MFEFFCGWGKGLRHQQEAPKKLGRTRYALRLPMLWYITNVIRGVIESWPKPSH